MAAVATKGASESGSFATRPVRRPSIRRTPGASNQSANMAAIPQRRSYWCRPPPAGRARRHRPPGWRPSSSTPRSRAHGPPTNSGQPRSATRPRQARRGGRTRAISPAMAPPSGFLDGTRRCRLATEHALIDGEHVASVSLIVEAGRGLTRPTAHPRERGPVRQQLASPPSPTCRAASAAADGRTLRPRPAPGRRPPH